MDCNWPDLCPPRGSVGTRLAVRGPLGHGFKLPAAARHIVLASLTDHGSRLALLVDTALVQGALAQEVSVVFCGDSPASAYRSEVEMLPLESLADLLAWADYLALDAAGDQISTIRKLLHLLPGQHCPVPAQVLVRRRWLAAAWRSAACAPSRPATAGSWPARMGRCSSWMSWRNSTMPPRSDLQIPSPWLNAAGMLGFAPGKPWPFDAPQGAFVTNPVSLKPRTPAGNRCLLPYPGGFLLHTGLPNPGLRPSSGAIAPLAAQVYTRTVAYFAEQLAAGRKSSPPSWMRVSGAADVVALVEIKPNRGTGLFNIQSSDRENG